MIALHLAEGFEEIEAITVVDVLRRAGVDARMISVSGSLHVTGSHGISVQADQLFEETAYETCEMILLPGGMPGSRHLKEHTGLAEKILQFQAQDKWLGAICAAPMVLGGLGVLTGKKATIFPGMEGELLGATVQHDRVVVDGKVITSRGPGTALEFSLQLAGILAGPEQEQKLRSSMLAGLADQQSKG